MKEESGDEAKKKTKTKEIEEKGITGGNDKNRSAATRENASRSYIDVNSAEGREAAQERKRRTVQEKKKVEDNSGKKRMDTAVEAANTRADATLASQRHREMTKLVTSSSKSSPLVLGEVIDEPVGATSVPTSGEESESESAIHFKQNKKLTQGSKDADGTLLTQEIEDGEDFVAEQRKNRNRLRKETLTKRSAEGAGEAMPKKVRKKQGDPENVSSHSIRTAFSLLQRKFDRHRDAATEKLAKLEKQLGQMRKQHAQRQRTRRLRSQRKDD